MANIFTKHFRSDFTIRKEQDQIFEGVQDSLREKKKFTIIQAPTGVGKSAIAHAIAMSSPDPKDDFVDLVKSMRIFKFRQETGYEGQFYFESNPRFGATVLTITKSLQDQYIKDFNETTSLKGMGNYPCAIDDNYSAEFAPCSVSKEQKQKCWTVGVCPYYNARNDAILSKFAVLNYSKYLSLMPHLRHKKYLILDECSEIEEVLVNQFTIELKYAHFDALGIPYNKFSCGVNNDILKDKDKASAFAWISGLSTKIDSLYKQKMQDINISKPEKRMINQLRALKRIAESLNALLENFDNTQYIVEYDVEKIKYVPFKVDKLAKQLFDQADHIIMMSATIVDHKNFAKSLGITDYKYVEVDSPFDPEKSPIVIMDNYYLNNKNMDTYLPKIAKLISELVAKHKGEKGVIHTNTHKITAFLEKQFKGNGRFLFRNENSNNEKIVEEHCLRKDDTVLVSPSLTYGLDLKGDLGLFQIIVKCPYPYLGDNRIKKMFELDKEWYSNTMLVELIQACGRTTRNENDTSVTYIIDTNVMRSLVNEKHKIPKYFLDRVQ